MYCRITKGRSANYLVIVQGYRNEQGLPRQRTICNLGKINDKNIAAAKKLGASLLEKFGAAAITTGQEISIASHKNFGAYQLLQILWNAYKLNTLFKNKLNTRKLNYNLQDLLQLMIAGRLTNPTSKLALFETQDKFLSFNHHPLHNFYKALDELYYYEHDLKLHLFEKQKEMNNNLIVSFFDVTTLYFESKSDDELKSFGFSKDCKFNDVQVVLSILSADDGTPLTFDLFPGNTSETKTMEKCLKRLKHELNLNKITVVADRGMYTKSNLSLISSLGYNYIVGCKIRSCSKDIKEQVFNDNDYKLSQINEANYKYKEIYKADSEKIVIAHSLKRAKKDKQDRTRLIEKALKVIAGSQGTDSYGGKQYIKRVNKSMELDNEKIEEDRKWDGYYAVSHNSEFNEQEVLAAYHGLWRVENSFRMLKNYFATRPMFHWTEKRIRGHVMLNFISYVFERYIEKEISTKSEISMAPNKIREAINSMQENYVTIGKLELKVPSKFSDNALKLMTALGINMPQNAIIKSND